METYLVTGGAGFIGSNIVEELLKKGHKVKIIDSFITGTRENIEPFKNDIELIEDDIRNIDAVKKAAKGADYVLHQAALRSVPKSVDDPTLTNDINVSGTLSVFLASKEAGVKRVVYASSSSVYGDCDQFPEKEEFMPKPISPYAVSKLAGEYYGYTFTKTFGLEVVSLRYFNVFGPRQNPESKYSAVIPAFIARMIEGKPPIIEGDGEQSRDFTYVKNVADANLAAAKAKDVGGEVFNIACQNAYSILDIVNGINGLLGKVLEPEFAPTRRGDVRKTMADISKMKDLLKIEPKVDFDTGLKKTMEWFQSK
ncbi:MAG: SDR family oxidoreductase [Candidatus Omnitrophica bacterium]|nr:SDR family oxidoreductase [Candidatus Omnitrophota bacterium]